MSSLPPVRGRGAAVNSKNRFESIERVPEPPQDGDDISSPQTQFFADSSKSIIAYNDSPDVGFDASVNPYRGCEHGCVYCYARPSHEYLGFSAGLDFETKIMVKEDAPDLLRQELSRRAWKPQLVALSGNTDCYQPVEKQKKLTRRCLEVLLEFRNPVVIITKNHLVTRDVDILSELARYDCVGVTLSVTTLDHKLSSLLEPRASRPARRFADTSHCDCRMRLKNYSSSGSISTIRTRSKKFSTACARFAAASSTIRTLRPACAAKASMPSRWQIYFNWRRKNPESPSVGRS